jgi:uncharacterized 2Fe-2S/4Fe-4S cluster protein (DUF4445 family)
MKIRVQNLLEIETREAETLLSALGRAGIPVIAPCGGKRRCAKCKVRILEGQVRNLISGELIAGVPSEVLACASVPESDILLELISENAYHAGAYEEIVKPTECARGFRAGVALDIGTTTVSARLVDIDSGEEMATYSALNQQRVFGADIMSRIGAARSGKTNELFSIINRQTREMLLGFMEKFSLSSIETLMVAANTTMLHLFANEDPSMMGEIPFTPVFLEGREYSGTKLSLPAGKVVLFPSISAFIGADIVSGLMEIQALRAKETIFFIDIGTNGEMALYHQGRLFCASAAAGPALEGAEISCGVGSILGAINKVEWMDNKINWTTIGAKDPIGICGCGLIDAMALMLEQGVIDETGAFADDDTEDFPIAPGISLVNRDVRQFQLAKSAILSGIKILCKNAALRPADIKNVFIAGGFGFFINNQNAINAGIFPGEFLDVISICGNLSLQGAEECLTSKNFMDRCKQITGKCSVIDLAADPSFMDEFAENMLFGS